MFRSVRADRLPILAALAALALPAAGAAQIPGGDPDEAFDRRDAARAEYRAEALSQVNEVLEAWADAWLDDAPDDLLDRYSDQARVRGLPFGFVSGEDALEERFTAYLPEVGDIRLNLREFNASGRLAYGVASYTLHVMGGDGSGTMRRGTLMTVLVKESGWKILSQLFVPAEGGGEADGADGGGEARG